MAARAIIRKNLSTVHGVHCLENIVRGRFLIISWAMTAAECPLSRFEKLRSSELQWLWCPHPWSTMHGILVYTGFHVSARTCGARIQTWLSFLCHNHCNIFLKIKSAFVYVWVAVHVYVYHMYVVSKETERVLGHLELEVQTVVKHHEGVENWTKASARS